MTVAELREKLSLFRDDLPVYLDDSEHGLVPLEICTSTNAVNRDGYIAVAETHREFAFSFGCVYLR